MTTLPPLAINTQKKMMTQLNSLEARSLQAATRPIRSRNKKMEILKNFREKISRATMILTAKKSFKTKIKSSMKMKRILRNKKRETLNKREISRKVKVSKNKEKNRTKKTQRLIFRERDRRRTMNL